MYFKYKTQLNSELIYIIQEELTMQWQLIRLFYEENCKNLFMFGTKLGVAFYSKVRFANANVQGMHSNMG